MRHCLAAVFLVGGLLLPGYLLAAGEVIPPPMPPRSLTRDATPPEGETLELTAAGVAFTLFLPEGWEKAIQKDPSLTVNFHTSSWVGIQQHNSRGLEVPLVSIYLGQGSLVYARPFLEESAFQRILAAVEREVRRRGAGAGFHFRWADISSFSAGYGAVRELAKQKSTFRLMRRVVLADSLYGGLDEEALKEGRRVPAQSSIDPWLPLAREAAEGRKTFVITVSEVETPTYASSWEVAGEIARQMGLEVTPAPDSWPAARDESFPLLSVAGRNGLQIWFYGGRDAAAHTTHPRHLGEIWKSLDAGGLR